MPMKLTIPADDAFNIRVRDHLRLVSPSKAGDMLNVHMWDDYSPWLRSVIVDASDEVVSVGFQKFWNLGQIAGDDDALAEILADGSSRVLYTEKMDGSLCVRSVVDGEVIFRTRGTFDGSDFGPPMRAVAAAKYPVLLDPSFMPEHSLLFEFVSPDFRIVVRYSEADLCLLGCVDHDTLTHLPYAQLGELAAEHDLHLVPCHDLPSTVEGMMEVVKVWEESEGVVVRIEGVPAHLAQGRAIGGVWLVKVKSADYLARHRLRFSMTAKFIRKLCDDLRIRSIEDFKDYIASIDGDWELVQDAAPLIDKYVSGANKADAEFAVLQAGVADALAQYETRKEFAIEYALNLGNKKTVAFLLADGHTESAEQKLIDLYVADAFAKAEAAEEALLEKDK